MACIIRYAEADDAEMLGNIYPAAYCSAYKGIVPDWILNGISSLYVRNYFYGLITKNLEKVALVYEENEIAGFMGFEKYKGKDLDDTWGEIIQIYLLPTFRGKGIGTEFLNWGMKELKGLGYKNVCLWVFEENLRGRTP